MQKSSNKLDSVNNAAWQHHENHVAGLYHRLGFTVTQNVSVDGQQVDIICEKWVEGIGRTRLCIDCKHTRLQQNNSVSKDDVDQFIFTFRNRAESNAWTAGVMVSNRPFSQYAKAAAAKYHNIHLKTIDELHEEILHVRSYLYDSVRRYEESNRFEDFIPPYGSLSQTPEANDNWSPLYSIIEGWLQDYKVQQLCLFGDFGTGKTTFLEYVHYSFAKKYLSDSSVRIPLFIPLRRYYEAADHEDVMKQFFSLECAANLQYSLFHEFLLTGRLLLLLDGFDEMGARSDPMSRKANYLKLAPLIEGGSKVLISCRPAYFLSFAETQSVFSFMNRQIGFAPPVKQGPVSEQLYRVVQDSDLKPLFAQTKTALSSTVYAHLRLFDKRQIRAYLKKHNDGIAKASGGQLDARRLFLRIKEIYDLGDLAQRPILLKLIVNTLPLFRRADDGSYEVELSGSVQKVPDITPSVLYSVYTEKELEREYKKGKVRWLIDRQDKVRAIAAIAHEMFRRDALALDKGGLAQVIEKVFPSDESEQAYYLTDIRTCSFLSRDSQDAVRFTHKSFMEYYAAVSLRIQMSGTDAIQNLLSTRPLSDEVAFFLGDSIAASTGAEEVTNSLVDVFKRLIGATSPPEACIQNVLNVLNYARKPISPIKGARVEALTYRKMALAELVLEDVYIGILRSIKLSVETLFVSEADIKRWEADGIRVSVFSAQKVDLRDMRFWNSRIETIEGSHTSFNIETWRSSTIKNAVLKQCIIVDADGSAAAWLPQNGIYEDCIFLGLNFKVPSFYQSKFVGCTFVMCTADLRPSGGVQIERCRGVFLNNTALGLRSWGHGVATCGAESARAFRSKSSMNLRSWEELLLSSFEGDPERSPRSASEIAIRLRQVDVAFGLVRLRGETVIVSGSDQAENSECRLVDCDAHGVNLLNLSTKAEFREPLRRVSVEYGHPVHLLVGNR